MLTRPSSLYDYSPEHRQTEPKHGPVEVIQHLLRHVKYAIAGAIGALAVAGTLERFGLVGDTSSVQLVIGGIGALALMGVAKYVRIL